MTETDPREHITHLNDRMVHATGANRYAYQPGEKPPPPIEAFYRLSPGAKVVIDPLHDARPIMFMSSAGANRAHVVVAREWGDLAWPAYLADVRARYVAECRAYIDRMWAPTRKAIGDARFELAQRRRAHTLAMLAHEEVLADA